MGEKLCEMQNADGSHRAWLFHCPACDAPHQCDERWVWNGSKTAPTFDGSVLVRYYEHPTDSSIETSRCHSHVTNGRIIYCSDSSRGMANQTVDLPDWDKRKG